MKRRTKANLYVLVIGCLSAVVLAACGSGSSTSATSEAADASAVSGKVVVWDTEYESTPGYTKAIKKLDAEFESQHSDADIERVAVPLESFETTYRSAFAAHEGPDVMVLQPGSARAFSSGLEGLSDRITPEMKSKLLGWELSSPELEAGGEHYAVPMSLAAYTFYFNKSLFKKANLPADFQPETWDELREAAEKLKAAGIQPFAGGNKEGVESLWWFSMALETEPTDTEILQLAKGEIPWTSEFVANAFQPQIEMQEADVYPASRFSQSIFTEGWQEFSEGEAAIVIGNSAGAGYWKEFNEALGEENVGSFLTPGSDHRVGVVDWYELGIPTFAQNKDGAWALIEFVASKESQETFQEDAGLMSNRTDQGLPASYPSQPRKFLKELRSRGSQPIPNAIMPTPVVYGPLQKEMPQVLQGRRSLEEAQEVMQETAEKTTN